MNEQEIDEMIGRIPNKRWSVQEVKFLCDNYESIGPAVCAHRLNTSYDSVVLKANRLGIRYRKRVTDKDKQFIVDNCKAMPVQDIAKELELSEHGVYGLSYKLGVKVSRRVKS